MDETSSHGVVEWPWVIDANASVVFEDVIAALRVAADKTRDTIMMTHAESVDKPFANAPFCALQKDVPVMFDAAAALEGGEQRVGASSTR